MPELPDGYVPPGDDDALLDECDVTYFQASGPGGQHRNRNRTAVRLHHRPSDLVVIGRRERSQSRNRLDALARLRKRLLELLKRRQSERKRLRSRPGSDE